MMAKCHIDAIVIDFYDFEQICEISREATQMFRPYRALNYYSYNLSTQGVALGCICCAPPGLGGITLRRYVTFSNPACCLYMD